MSVRADVGRGCLAAALALTGLGAGTLASADDLPPVGANAPWTLELQSDDPDAAYVVYKRVPPGSPYAAYRLEAVIDAPPEVVAEAARVNLLDPDERPSRTRKQIVRDDGDVVIVHSYIEMPPLVTDRDILTRAERFYDPRTETHRIVWHATDDGPPPEAGVIRVEKSEGSWLFEPLADGRTRVTYESHTEIAGSIPAWFVNAVMNETVVDGFEGLRARVESQREGG